jgi:NAD(P)-dependent dehydrogenase (short-subunit alcohol dehydrogenase family)
MKQIIVTGSSSGFGLLITKSLASKGHKVYATMRNIGSSNAVAAAQLKEWARSNGHALTVVEMDVTSTDSVNKAIASIAKEANGIIDVAINNAGISFTGVAESLTIEQTENIFQINVFGADRVIKAVLPYMHKQHDGLIINVTSVLARNQLPLTAAYNATKAALDALSVGYFYELRSSGIDVAVVQPGGYPTTDIITKGIKAGNPVVENLYGKDVARIKEAFIQYFTPNETSPDPQEVADVIVGLIETPKGQRQLWTPVGTGPLTPYLSQVNELTKTLVDATLQSMGV